MANKETNNFKQALNELLAGKLTTDETAAPAADTYIEPAAEAVEQPAAANDTYQKAIDVVAEIEKTLDHEETVITKGVIIEGNIRTTSKLTIIGEVTGNVISSADLVIKGKVGGSIEANNITLSQCEVKDTVTAQNEVNISAMSVVNGDIKSGSVNSNGTVLGNINANKVVLSEESKTVGDVVCKTIRISEGASLKGKLETVD
ncbi:MAG: polymer-forming cytoskeletal protein [Oscillospiraceae bacterium]|nr:polymer-forming cytoskeletal protein [Oscillospiraceae bacterium]MBQ5312801.1 polymer-forming cytoskeletal protein [Oscillospiraceae bacterium]